MERRSDINACEKNKRIGHEFYSCQFEPFNETGFSRWGIKSGPQGLKPSAPIQRFGTTRSRALPGSVGPVHWSFRTQRQPAGSSTTQDRSSCEQSYFARNDSPRGEGTEQRRPEADS